MDFKYNYVFLFAASDYIHILLGEEVIQHPQVRVYQYAFDAPAYIQKVFHYHTAYKINHLVNLPLKSIWFKRMYNQDFENNLPICFVYVGGNMVRYDGGFTSYIKKKNPKNKVVMLHLDLISKKIDYDYNLIWRKVDLAVTYDLKEARQYKIHYFDENVYSKFIDDDGSTEIEQDIYFLGAAKDRLCQLIDINRFLTKNGITTKFLITGVSEKDRVFFSGIKYIDGISYKENLQNVIRSKCILEVIQKGSTNITLRAREAIAYHRRLLTNCSACKEENYNAGQLQIFSDINNIDVDFIRKEYRWDDYYPKVDLNPMRRIQDIEHQLLLMDNM